MESDTFCGDFAVKLVWRLSGVFMEKVWVNQITLFYMTSKDYGSKIFFQCT